MVSFGPSIRPRCFDILHRSDQWSLSKDIFEGNISEFNEYLNEHTSHDYSIFNEFISYKLKIHEIIG